MEELYQAIEEKIKSSGYPREISGEAVYEDICDQIDGTVMDHEFNLGILTMRLPEGVYAVNFDED